MKYLLGVLGIHFFSVVLLCSVIGGVVWYISHVFNRKGKANIKWNYLWCKITAIVFCVPFAYLIVIAKWRNGYLFSTTTIFYWITVLLGFAWIAGVIVQLVRYYFKTKKMFLLRKSLFECEVELNRVWDEVREELHFHRRVSLHQSYMANSPLVFGFFHKRVVLPAKHYKREELRAVFIHEFIHIQHGDSIWKVLLNILNCIYWFHPAMKQLHKEFCLHCETACDLEANPYCGGTIPYFEIVVDMAIDNSKFSSYMVATLYENKNLLAERVEIVMAYDKGKKLKAGVLAALALTVCVAGSATVYASSVGYQKGYTYLAKESEVGTDTTEEFPLESDLEIFYEAENESSYVDEIVEENGVNSWATSVSIDWDVKPGYRVKSGEFYKAKGSTVSITALITPSKTMEIGIINRNGEKWYVKTANDFTRAFTVQKSGYYRVYAANDNSVTVNVLGRYQR